METQTLIEMAKVIKAFTETEKEGILNNIRNRDWYGAATPLDHLKKMKALSEEEQTCWEQWYLKWLEDVMIVILKSIIN